MSDEHRCLHDKGEPFHGRAAICVGCSNDSVKYAVEQAERLHAESDRHRTALAIKLEQSERRVKELNDERIKTDEEVFQLDMRAQQAERALDEARKAFQHIISITKPVTAGAHHLLHDVRQITEDALVAIQGGKP